MMPSPANMYADLLQHDLCAFIHRSFLELNSQRRFLVNWHIEMLAAKLEEVRRGSCKRLIINVPPRHLKSHATSIAFPAWVLGHEPAKQILCVTYAQDLSDKFARDSRTLRRWYIRYLRRSLWVLTRTSLCPRTDMLQRRNLRSRSVGEASSTTGYRGRNEGSRTGRAGRLSSARLHRPPLDWAACFSVKY